MAKAREEWSENAKDLDASKLNFLDESSVNLGMTRLYGRAAKHERVVDYVPDVRFQRQSILSTVRLDGTQFPFVFKGTLNAELFAEYVKKILAPAFRKDDVLVLDNSPVHTSKLAMEAFEECKMNVLFLPQYSPDFNPIEMLWSKMKAHLKKVRANTHEALVDAISEALDLISASDVSGWFKHCGYFKH